MASNVEHSELLAANPRRSTRPICRYFLRNACRFGSNCRFSHAVPEGGMSANAHVTQREEPALTAHEQQMLEKSKDKSCGICLDVIMEKPLYQRRFGILPNCTHIFCADCIRKWRKSKSAEVQQSSRKTCPECRVMSAYVCHSKYWVDTKEEKDKLLSDYRKTMSEKPCVHFAAKRKCRFGNECFYKHALPNGQLVDLGKPKPRRASRPEFDLGAAFHLEDFLIDMITEYWDEYMEFESDSTDDSDDDSIFETFFETF